MKLRIADRILVAVAGLLLLACCAGIVAQMFFGADMVGLASKVFASQSVRARTAVIGLAVFLLLLGIYCVFVLFRHRKRKDKFILQKNDSGELAISVKALENMVQKCLDQHEELKVQHLYLENKKDGLLIRIRGAVAGGISIPLTVEALQKQVRQYVTACSGVEIKGIRVQIESSGEDAKDAPFAIAAPVAMPLLHESQEKQTPVQKTDVSAEQAEPPAPAPAAMAQVQEAPAPVEEAIPEEEDDRPLHQRLFSSKPSPCIIPEPPSEQDLAFEETKDENPESVAQEAEQETEPDSVSDRETESVFENTEENTEKNDTEKDSGSEDDFEESLKTFDDLIQR